jgi:hypothetical protein
VSLASRLTAFAQAVGADIKSLRTDVDAFGAVSAKALHFYVASAQTLGAGNPVNWTGEVVDTDNIRSANLTEITLPAGIWWVEAGVRPDTAITAASYVQALLQVDGVTRAEGIGVQVSGGTSPKCTIPGIPVISDGTTKIKVLVYSTTSGGTFPSTTGLGSGTSITATVAGGATGPQGPVGGNATVPIEDWKTVGADGGLTTFVNNWVSYGGAHPLQYRKRPDGSVEVRGLAKGGTGGASAAGVFTFPAGYTPNIGATAAQFFESVAYSGGAYVDSAKVQVNGNGLVTSTYLSPAGGFVAFDAVRFTTSQATFPSGPKGDKGDPGTVSVVKTLNWNTATQPNFYRSTNDGLEQTINGPGDTLNPPKQAGVVYLHESGSLIQRVWDLDYQVGYTRYRAPDGSTWSPWVKDLQAPSYWTELLIGGTYVTGDERYFQNAAMKTNGCLWKYRYDSTLATYKWAFAGGSPWRSKATAGYTCVAPNAWEIVSNTIFPRFTVPLSGIYRIQYGCRFHQAVNTSVEGYVGIGKTTDATPLDSLRFNAGQNAVGVDIVYLSGEMEVTLTEGQILALFHNTQVAVANIAYAGQWMLVEPLRTG